MILCVAANPSIDRLFAVDRLVPGAIHRPADFVQVAGGKGLNVARAAAALGGNVHAAALLGGHAGRWVAEQLEAEGITLHAAWAEGETRSSLSVEGAIEGLTEFYEHGQPVSEGEWSAFAELVAAQAPMAAWMTLSGSLPPGAPADGYLPLMRLAPVALDSREAGVEARPQVVKLNAAEAAELTRLDTGSPALAAAAAGRMHEATAGTAIVTLGRDGAVLAGPDGRVVHGSVAAEGRYPVGSGDAFLAGLVVALDAGAGWEDALRAALGAGAANAELPGAGVLERGRAEELTEEAAVHNVEGSDPERV
jgi:1-phosphofructokinase family hexose kinase